MLGITTYSKSFFRSATIMGFFLSLVSLVVALVTLVVKIVKWDYFPVGIAALLIGVFFLGGIQLFFIGLLGEYIMNMNIRIMNRPLVIEEKRINFDAAKE
jgi:hypothetical protein